MLPTSDFALVILNFAQPDADEHPFAPEGAAAYRRWRERKLARYPRRAEDLVVEVREPRALTSAEIAEVRRICGAANMAIYATPLGSVPDKDIPRRIGEQLGLGGLIANPLADDDGVSALETMPEKSGRGYVPYSNRGLSWHTDGYYNPPERRIRAFILHCVRTAASGGENRLLDPEIAYILLRDADPSLVKALSAHDAMTIPANTEGAQQRDAQAGPVFAADGGTLHMRYTARTRSIEWRADAATLTAARCLRQILDADSRYVLRVRLEAGQGLVCNNVLHDRSAFTDPPAPQLGRLVYRARYSGRIATPAPEAVRSPPQHAALA